MRLKESAHQTSFADIEEQQVHVVIELVSSSANEAIVRINRETAHWFNYKLRIIWKIEKSVIKFYPKY
jgi:uncharacterized Fe-S cluster-containing radical SAM superfamily protein